MLDKIKVKVEDLNDLQGWSKIIKAGVEIPLPKDAARAKDIPGDFLKSEAIVEMYDGDCRFLATRQSIKKGKVVWYQYSLEYFKDGNLWLVLDHYPFKKALIAAGLPKEIEEGSGGLAACVRSLWGIRGGYSDAWKSCNITFTQKEYN